MKGLRIELGGETLDIVSGDFGFATLVLHADFQVVEPFDHGNLHHLFVWSVPLRPAFFISTFPTLRRWYLCRDVLPRSERAEEDAADDRDAECGTDLERRDDGPRWMGPAARIRGGILSWRPSPSRRADVQHYCDFQFRDSGPGSARDQRTVRKNARISFASSSGCSRAGKCPPRSIFVQRVMFPYMRSASDRGGRRNSFGNSA